MSNSFATPQTVCSPPVFSVHGDFPSKNTGVGCHFFLQEIFPIQGLKPHHLHCERILAHWATRKVPWGSFRNCLIHWSGHPWWLSSKESSCNAGDAGLIPGSGRCPGGGNGNPFQYSCLDNPVDREAWLATVHRVEKSWTWLKWLSRYPIHRSHCIESRCPATPTADEYYNLE